ncbi:phage tail sheath subtilisin-like domain-containing protein [Amycolatopsis sp. NBC_00345]|uniref:phage tail sheath family protein n=1 Tax=Amycolatopsis sp. NBC_00345 TaxID=2975955 RepID=UPI002E257692
MPITPTYPGVYIDELPSAVRTIVGVPTSTAAFLGTAPRGAVDKPVHITSWEDYEQEFGGLDAGTDLAYAVYQFYANGGSEAEIVRVVRKDGTPLPAVVDAAAVAGAAPDAAPAPETAAVLAVAASITLAGGVKLFAASPGIWANDNTLRARVDYDTALDPDNKLYNLTIRDAKTGVTEQYLNVSKDRAASRALKNVLASSSLIGSAEGDDQRPAAHADVTDGSDPFPDDQKGQNLYTAASGGLDGSAPSHKDYLGDQEAKTGLYALLNADIFNMLCLPGEPGLISGANILTEAMAFCVERRAMLIVDPDPDWKTVAHVTAAVRHTGPVFVLNDDNAKNAALYFPQIVLPDVNQENAPRKFPPCGVLAGIWARTDVQRGVWKAPAGTEATLSGVTDLTVPLTDKQNGVLNPLGVNCLRGLPVVGNVVWGARTQRGADVLANQWKYLPVRRLALYLEESLYRGTQWVVFEPNDEPLWSSIRLNVGAFMNTLFRQGAFQGRTPKEAYVVKCDATNNPQNDIDRGIVNILVGFAPLKPAEFVLIHIQQLAGAIQV